MGDRRTRSGRRIRSWRGITTILVAAMAATLVPAVSPSQRAEAAPPIDICNQILVSGPGGKYVNAQNRIFQVGSPPGAICRLEQQAMATIAARHGQPFDDVEQLRMLSWGRDEVRAELWGQLLRIISSTDRTPDEQAAYDWLQTRVREKKLQMAQAAKSEYDRWHGNPCAYVAPAAPSYQPNCADGTLLQLFTGPPAPPGYDDFVAYGASMTLSEYQTDEAARVAANTARFFSHLASFSNAFGIVSAVGLAGFGLAIALGATLGSVFPFAAAGFTAGAVGVTGAFAFVVLMAVVAIVRGVQVFEDAKIPERLDQDVVDASVPPNLVDYLDSAPELNLMYTAFLSGTLPDYPDPPFKPAAPTAPGPGSPSFMLVRDGTFQWVDQFTYVGPDGSTNTVWLDRGWFVIDPGDGSANVMTHELQFLTGPGQGVRSAMITPTGRSFQVFDASTLDSKYPCTAPACTTESRLTMLQPGTAAASQRVYLMDNPLTISSGPTVTGNLTQHGTVTLSATATSTFAGLGPITYRWRLTHDSTAMPGEVVEQFLDGQNPTFVVPQPGEYGVTVTATDATGASVSASTTFSAGAAVAQLTIQQGPPSGSNPLGIGPYWYEGTAGTLSVTATEPGTFSVSFDGHPEYDVSGYGPGLDTIVIDAPTYPNEGYHPVHVQFLSDDGDVVDQVAYLEVRNARPDNPELQVLVAGSWEYLNDPSVDLQFNEGDTLHVRYRVHDRGATDDLTVTLIWPDTGHEVLTHVAPDVWHEVTHHLGDQSSFGPGVAARVVDDALSASGTTEAFFSVMNVAPTISDVVATVDGDGVATLSARYGDAVPEVGRAEINWGDGTPVQQLALPMSLAVDDGSFDETDATFPLSPDELRATHQYGTLGLYDVTLRVFDDLTSTSTTVRVTFMNMRPQIDDLTVFEVRPNLNLYLEAELRDPDAFELPSARVLHVDWGDGTTSDVGWDPATGTHPASHTYPSVGTYTVVLTAVDGLGTRSEEVRGTVQIVEIPGALQGTVTADGAPADGVVVTLMDEWPLWTVAGSTITDSSGHYRFDDLPPSQLYRLRFYDPRGRFERTWWNARSTYSTGTPITIVTGDTVIADQSLLPASSGVLRGRVTESVSGTPLPNVAVQVFSTNGFVAGARTGPLGYYQLAALPQGSYWVRFVDPAHAHQAAWHPGVPSFSSAQLVTLGSSALAVNASLIDPP